jgi:hypothetical protein
MTPTRSSIPTASGTSSRTSSKIVLRANESNLAPTIPEGSLSRSRLARAVQRRSELLVRSSKSRLESLRANVYLAPCNYQDRTIERVRLLVQSFCKGNDESKAPSG